LRQYRDLAFHPMYQPQVSMFFGISKAFKEVIDHKKKMLVGFDKKLESKWEKALGPDWQKQLDPDS